MTLGSAGQHLGTEQTEIQDTTPLTMSLQGLEELMWLGTLQEILAPVVRGCNTATKQTSFGAGFNTQLWSVSATARTFFSEFTDARCEAERDLNRLGL